MPSSRKTAATTADTTNPRMMRLLNLSQFEVLTIGRPLSAQATEYEAIALNLPLLMHDNKLDAHADGLVRTIIPSIRIGSIISPIGIGIIICIIWLSLSGLHQVTQPC